MLARTALIGILFASAAQAQSTAFTYQGQLKSGTAAATGLHDLRFRLFDAASGGTQIGATLCADNVSVAGGLFTTTLDFGQQFATPAARFLEIEVRADTGLSCANTTGYTLLGSRQLLAASPLANHAKSAFALDAPDGSPTSAVFVDNNGSVGVGTVTPGISTPGTRFDVVGGSMRVENLGDQADLLWLASERSWVFRQEGAGVGAALKLQNIGGGGNKNFLIQTTGSVGVGTLNPTHTMHIASAVPTLALQDTDSTTQQVGYISYRDSANVERAWVGYGSAGDPDFSIINARPGGDIVLNTFGGGRVGVGTASPAAMLDVAGTARVQVLEITGADLAEKFPASETLEPGTVVAIDAKNPGKLCVSRGTYNRCVAGVVSGANNFSVGAVLGNLPGQEDAPSIALSGRVYVRCDAAAGAIEPGDLLTTSDTPGHAMKAADRDRSHGAVIGKAMGRLESGRGLVMVLVNLQ